MAGGSGQGLGVRLLGGFELRAGGRVVLDESWPRRKALALVKLLALQPGRSLHREQIADVLWPETSVACASNNLRQILFTLRSALSARGVSRDLIPASGDRLALSPPLALDVDEFRELATLAGHNIDACERALVLYAGDLLPDDLYEAWSEPHRQWLRGLRDRLLIEVANHHLNRGSFEQASERFQELLLSEPANEEAHRGLMQCYAAMGLRERALRQYVLCRETLRDELDAGPSKATTSLKQQLASGDEPQPASDAVPRALVVPVP